MRVAAFHVDRTLVVCISPGAPSGRRSGAESDDILAFEKQLTATDCCDREKKIGRPPLPRDRPRCYVIKSRTAEAADCILANAESRCYKTLVLAIRDRHLPSASTVRP